VRAGLSASSSEVRSRQGPEFKANGLAPVSDPLDEIAAHVDGTFVLVVKGKAGRYRRRCFLTAASAERAARNAQAAGHPVEVYLAELKPFWRLTGWST
jgi:hypothetical protein